MKTLKLIIGIFIISWIGCNPEDEAPPAENGLMIIMGQIINENSEVLANEKIYLAKNGASLENIYRKSEFIVDSVFTNSDGNYLFKDTLDGKCKYLIYTEKHQEHLFRQISNFLPNPSTYPSLVDDGALIINGKPDTLFWNFEFCIENDLAINVQKVSVGENSCVIKFPSNLGQINFLQGDSLFISGNDTTFLAPICNISMLEIDWFIRNENNETLSQNSTMISVSQFNPNTLTIEY